MKVYRFKSYSQYKRHLIRNEKEIRRYQSFEDSLIPSGVDSFVVNAYSYTAEQKVPLHVDFQHAPPGKVNWRERLLDPVTGFNNRMRATFQMFDFEMGAYSDSEIYITEQVTPIYDYFASKFKNITGSEYLGENATSGEIDSRGIRHEDLISLSFSDETFDQIISLDVLEHIPDYQKAFSECYRVLKPGGRLMWSVPFIAVNAENSIRARIADDGTIEHILPAEYHGDPMSDKGVLCFQHFGWEMLDQMRECGFKDAYAMCYWSSEFGYLGGEQFLFFAEK